jgi:hypothetical protein
MFDRLKLRPISFGHSKFGYVSAETPGENSTELFQKKYEALDRKCLDFITKHEDLHKSYRAKSRQDRHK